MGEKMRVIKRKAYGDKNHVPSRTVKSKTTNSLDSPFSKMLHLQRTIGNSAVTELIQSGVIQAKLRIGQSNDIYEQEADRVAEQVMRMTGTCPECEGEELITPLVQRQVVEEEDEEEAIIQTTPASGSTLEVKQEIQSSIQSQRGGGQPLSQATRNFFEPRFGANFSQVRVHSGARAAETAEALNAKAFTTGRDVFMGASQYSPGTSAGRHLLAHELTHVLQQDHRSPGLQRQTPAPTAPTCPPTCHATAAGAAADVDAHVVPRNCFVWQVGTAQCPRGCGRWQAMPGTGCAHWVAHQMGITNGLTCNAGRSVRVRNVTSGRTSHPLTQAQVGDIWTNTGQTHTGIVRQLRHNTATPPAITGAEVEHDSSAQGGVVRNWFTTGSFWR